MYHRYYNAHKSKKELSNAIFGALAFIGYFIALALFPVQVITMTVIVVALILVISHIQ